MKKIVRERETAHSILEQRYLLRDESGKIVEDVNGLFDRVAAAVASAEKTDGAFNHYKCIFEDMMKKFDFLPNSPTLMNAGTKIGQLSACFVLPIEDSMEGIFQAIKNTAIIHKSGGGTGFNFSSLRHEGAIVKSTGGTSSGPISFMKVFDAATDAVKQGGKRRGASMAILRVDHPDILKFIECKDDLNTLNNFNISVAITDVFMDAVKNHTGYNIFDHESNVIETLDANVVFDRIVHQAWKNGEPGVMFIDRVNAHNIYGTIEATNPCGEQPLLPYEACNLGSINLANMLMDTRGKLEIDYNKLYDTVSAAVRFLDDVIEVNNYPLPEIDKTTKKSRKIGLGVMGFADMLTMLEVPYNSDKALAIASDVMNCINEYAKRASETLYDERGAFPAYADIDDDNHKYLRRNLYITTIAPTGTISMIAGASSGIEPLFGVSYYKQCMDGQKFMEINPYFEQVAKDRGFYSEELMKKVVSAGSIKDIEEIPQDVRDVFVTTHDISPEWHVKMQAAFQAEIDNAISKTINFHHSATEDDIRTSYMLAYDLGCKGITVYRDGSRMGQVLNMNENKDETAEAEEPIEVRATMKPRDEFQYGFTRKMEIGCGSIYITINHDADGNIFEVFTTLGKGGGCSSQSEATARLASLAFRSGIDPKEVVKQIRGIKCTNCIRGGKKLVGLSCPDSIARTIEEFIAMQKKPEIECKCSCDSCTCKKPKYDGEKIGKLIEDHANLQYVPNADMHVATCPECGALLYAESGCLTCSKCAWSKCS